VLIISLTVVQISVAFIESVRKQVDKGMPRALDLGHKDSRKGSMDDRGDSTDLANKSTGPTDCAKPMDVRKRYMSNTMLLTSNS
jgi:hypothetical protein